MVFWFCYLSVSAYLRSCRGFMDGKTEKKSEASVTVHEHEDFELYPNLTCAHVAAGRRLHQRLQTCPHRAWDLKWTRNSATNAL